MEGLAWLALITDLSLALTKRIACDGKGLRGQSRVAQ